MRKNIFVILLLLMGSSSCSSTKSNDYINQLHTDKPKIVFGDITSSISKAEIKKNTEKLLYKIRTSI